MVPPESGLCSCREEIIPCRKGVPIAFEGSVLQAVQKYPLESADGTVGDKKQSGRVPCHYPRAQQSPRGYPLVFACRAPDRYEGWSRTMDDGGRSGLKYAVRGDPNPLPPVPSAPADRASDPRMFWPEPGSLLARTWYCPSLCSLLPIQRYAHNRAASYYQ